MLPSRIQNSKSLYINITIIAQLNSELLAILREFYVLASFEELFYNKLSIISE